MRGSIAAKLTAIITVSLVVIFVPIVLAISAVTGEGLGALREALDGLFGRVPARPAAGVPRPSEPLSCSNSPTRWGWMPWPPVLPISWPWGPTR